jgi:hypothetical protein
VLLLHHLKDTRLETLLLYVINDYFAGRTGPSGVMLLPGILWSLYNRQVYVSAGVDSSGGLSCVAALLVVYAAGCQCQLRQGQLTWIQSKYVAFASCNTLASWCCCCLTHLATCTGPRLGCMNDHITLVIIIR